MIDTIVATALPVDERLLIRKNVISYGSSKKRICVVTGTHGDELEGQYVCYELARRLKEQLGLLNGTVEIYPSLNPLGMDSMIRGVPGFDLDMNRIFPGGPDGTMAESAAHAIVEDSRGADLVIDIHSSNVFLREVPQARINVHTADTLVPFAKMLNLDFVWVHEAATVLESTLAHSLNSVDTPCVVVEMGVGMRVHKGMGNRLVTGILNLMNHEGMWAEAVEDHMIAKPILSCGPQVEFVNAAASGIFLPENENATIVEKGQEIGVIVSSLTGDVLHKVVAPVYGYLFTIRAFPIVYEGSLIARIHKL